MNIPPDSAWQPEPDVSASPKANWLIHKDGRGWYMPNASGYTNSPAAAGRYTYDEAMRLTHPNGLSGPRDGLTSRPECEVAGAMIEFGKITPHPDTALLVRAVEALRAIASVRPKTDFGIVSKNYTLDQERAAWALYHAILSDYDKRKEKSDVY